MHESPTSVKILIKIVSNVILFTLSVFQVHIRNAVHADMSSQLFNERFISQGIIRDERVHTAIDTKLIWATLFIVSNCLCVCVYA